MEASLCSPPGGEDLAREGGRKRLTAGSLHLSLLSLSLSPSCLSLHLTYKLQRAFSWPTATPSAGRTARGPSFPGEGSIPVCHHGRLPPQSSKACISSSHVMKTVVVDQRAPSIRSQDWLLENCSFKLLVNLTEESNLISDTLKPGMKQYHCVDTIL